MNFDEQELLKEEVSNLKKNPETLITSKTMFNQYADRQLKHLVLSEEFDFDKIADLLSTQNYI